MTKLMTKAEIAAGLTVQSRHIGEEIMRKYYVKKNPHGGAGGPWLVVSPAGDGIEDIVGDYANRREARADRNRLAREDAEYQQSKRNADHIDGFDRDDLGESPDF